MNQQTIQAAHQKYLQLGREIEKMPAGIDRDNMQHTHSKLGIFLEDAFGRKAWRGDEPKQQPISIREAIKRIKGWAT